MSKHFCGMDTVVPIFQVIILSPERFITFPEVTHIVSGRVRI